MKTKKSLLIAPALGVLLLAAAGSVSGTVAWFSAVRVFNTDVANFSVVETDGNLDVTLDDLDGTTYNAVSKKIRVNDDAVLTHGSVNIDREAYEGANYGKAFVINPDSPVANPTFLDRGVAGNADPSWLYKPNLMVDNNDTPDPTPKEVDVYIAVSWKMTFKYTFAGDKTPVIVYLDLKDSSFADNATPVSGYEFTKDAKSGKREDTAKGFRIGFYNGVYASDDESAPGSAAANKHDVVWGNHTPGEELKTTKYKGAYAASQTYAVGDFVLDAESNIYECTAAVATSTNWGADSDKFKPARISVIAPAHSSTKAYKEGDVVTESAKTYRCKADIAAKTFTSSDWDEIKGLEKLSYVNGTAAGSTLAYTAMNYVVNDAGYSRVENAAEAANSNTLAERICVLTDEHPSVTITCAAWFEGTDPNVISGAAMKCMSASMTFYSRSADIS